MKVPAGDDELVLFYGSSAGNNNNCNATSSFLIEKYSLDDRAIFVVPTGYGLCLKENSCSLCVDGEFKDPTSDLSSCLNQICQ